MPITVWLAVLTLLIAAGQMAWTRRAEPAREAAAGIVRLVLATSTAVAVINLLVAAGDSFSVWIVNRCMGCQETTASKACIEKFSSKLLEMTTLHDVDQLAISLILALLLSFSGLVQLVCVIIRQAMLLVLVGTLPLAAAASSTEKGRAWWAKSCGWIGAFIALKPTAAIIYAAAFSEFETNDSKELLPQLYGVVLLILAAFTLPALMRFVVPLMEHGSIGCGGSGGAGMAARVASGAIALKTGGARAAAAAAGNGRGGVRPVRLGRLHRIRRPRRWWPPLRWFLPQRRSAPQRSLWRPVGWRLLGAGGCAGSRVGRHGGQPCPQHTRLRGGCRAARDRRRCVRGGRRQARTHPDKALTSQDPGTTAAVSASDVPRASVSNVGLGVAQFVPRSDDS